MFRLLRETPEDRDEVEILFDLAFAPGRGALSSYQLRDEVPAVAQLCTVVRDDYDALAGAIRYWPIRIGAKALPALLLGPVAVHPTRQGEGIGALMIMETLDLARRLGWERVLLVGDEPYYCRFGFSRELGAALDFPQPVNVKRVLARALVEGALEGVSGPVYRWTKGK